jgi:hypothetical protein
LHDKRSSSANLAFYIDLAVVGAGYIESNRQAQTDAIRTARLIRTIKPIKNMG